MNIPNELLYTNDHEWAKFEDGIVTVGISDFAQGELGDIIFIELPEIEDEVEKNEAFGTIEAVKTVTDLLSPVDGTVAEVNTELEDAPETVNEDCYGNGWFVKIKVEDNGDKSGLLSAEEYKALVE
jgi:glycine cleavage system H protein